MYGGAMANTKRGNFKTMFSAPEAQEKGTTTEGKRPDRVGKKQTIFHMPEAAKKIKISVMSRNKSFLL